jgi:hypothetical protein
MVVLSMMSSCKRGREKAERPLARDPFYASRAQVVRLPADGALHREAAHKKGGLEARNEDCYLDIEVEDDPEPLPELEPLDELPELEPPDELPELDPLDELPELEPLELPELDPDELPELDPLLEELPELEPLDELPELDPLEELPELDPLEKLPELDPLPEELPELDPLPEELPELLVDAFAMFKNLIELSNFFGRRSHLRH